MNKISIASVLFCICALAGPAYSSESFPEYPKTQALCAEHVSGTPFHIDWKSASSSEDTASVVGFFEQKMQAKSKAGDHGSSTFSHPKDPNLVLTIYPASEAAHFPACQKKPEASAKTILMTSQAIR